MLVVCCDRGAPGATTTALALAAVSGGPAIMVEADPYGGDVAVRCRPRGGRALTETPTVLTAAVAARTDRSSEMIGRCAQPLVGPLSVIPGQMSAEQAAAITDWSPLAEAMAASSVPVVADVGRIHARSPSLPIAAAGDVVVVVARAEVPGVVHLRDRLSRLVPALAGLRGSAPRLLPVLITPRRPANRHVAELAAVLVDTAAAPLLVGVGWLAWDPGGVARLEAGEALPALARTPLLRSAATVHAQAHGMVSANGRRQPSVTGGAV